MAVADTDLAVMGTSAHIRVEGREADALLAQAVLRMWELEGRWSRFRDDSEVSTVNRRAGTAVRVSQATRTLFTVAREAFACTGGAFDPTVLGDVVRSGYDRTFAAITDASARTARSELRRDAASIVVDDPAETVLVAPGVGFDPGGVGKGLAADLVAEELLASGARRALVNIGGDVRVAAAEPSGSDARFEIADPTNGRAVARIGLADGAVATSTTARAWTRAGVRVHHIIDPRTGDPVGDDLASVSVVARRCWQAEALTKAVFVDGVDAGFAMVDQLGAAASAITSDGSLRCSDNWRAAPQMFQMRAALPPAMSERSSSVH